MDKEASATNKQSDNTPTRTESEATLKPASKPPETVKKSAKVAEQNTPRAKRGQSKKSSPFTAFESLNCPPLIPQLTCSSLKSLSKRVDLRYYNPSAYFVRGYDWEKLEPLPCQSATPITDPATIRKPMEATFDEIWCPLIADSAEKLGVTPDEQSYLTEAELMAKQTLINLTSLCLGEEHSPGAFLY